MEEIELKKNKMKLVFDCQFCRCPIRSDSDLDCEAICDRCNLYTSFGEKVKSIKCKETGEIFEIGLVTGDEFIFCSKDGDNIFSMSRNIKKLNETFEIEEIYDDYLDDDDDDNNEYTCNYVLSWYYEDE